MAFQEELAALCQNNGVCTPVAPQPPKPHHGHCNVAAVGTPRTRLLSLTSALLPALCIWCRAPA